MKKTVITSFLLLASNEVISYSRMVHERRLLRKNSLVRFLAMTKVEFYRTL
jgi:hypothetical protein